MSRAAADAIAEELGDLWSLLQEYQRARQHYDRADCSGAVAKLQASIAASDRPTEGCRC